MPRAKSVTTNEELRSRIALCRELGVLSYSETAAGFSFQLGPIPFAPPLRVHEPEEVLTDAERNARRTREFRRVATLHNPAARNR